MTIRFYYTAGPYGAFSGWSRHPFDLDGCHWLTLEHFYQAQKYAGTPYAEQVRLAETPRAAKELGRRADWPLRPDWEQVKDAVMLRGVLAKFTAHDDLRTLLLSTGDEEIVEDSRSDYYWGRGADGTGLNKLGLTLMAARAVLRGMTLADLHHTLSSCRRCADAGYFIGSTPIFSGHAGAIFMTVGQAPGRHEADVTHRPFSGPAGRRLFRWLAQAGFDEAEFRATQAMVAITRCYPGPHPAGRGDRVPTRAEQAFCAPWLEAELTLIQPKVLIPIGGLAIWRFLGDERNPVSGIEASAGFSGRREQPAKASTPEAYRNIQNNRVSKTPTMTNLIGEQFERDGRIVVPLPHPSGASQWFNAAENKARLERALQVLAVLRQTLLDGQSHLAITEKQSIIRPEPSRPKNDAWGRELDRVSHAMRADAQAAGLTEQNAEERIAQAVDRARGGVFRTPA